MYRRIADLERQPLPYTSVHIHRIDFFLIKYVDEGTFVFI